MITKELEDRAKIDEVIRRHNTCFVGMIDLNGLPYVLPMNFGYDGDTIYLHSGPESNCLKALALNPNVCVTFNQDSEVVYQTKEVACSYRMKGTSVICRGKVVLEEDIAEKIKCLNIIMSQYSDLDFKYSEPAVRNVVIWKIKVDEVAARVFGIPHRNSRRFEDKSEFY